MQEVFEKIIEKLESEAKRWEDSGTEYKDKCEIAVGRGLRNAIEIVKQEAEKCNNGWISCSEQLPEEYSVLCCDKYGEMIVGHPYFDEVSNTNYSAESDNEMMYNCIAWKPLPEPYQNKS